MVRLRLLRGVLRSASAEVCAFSSATVSGASCVRSLEPAPVDLVLVLVPAPFRFDKSSMLFGDACAQRIGFRHLLCCRPLACSDGRFGRREMCVPLVELLDPADALLLLLGGVGLRGERRAKLALALA
jgi:hypothetical protein